MFSFCTQKRKKTTCAHQLAVGVVAFSPLQFLFRYDQPSDYRGEREVNFFRRLPTVWDQTRVINGQIGKNTTKARRRGADWFVGTIDNQTARRLKIPLHFLSPGRRYLAHIYGDNPQLKPRTDVVISTRVVDCHTVLKVPLIAPGGQAMWLAPLAQN